MTACIVLTRSKMFAQVHVDRLRNRALINGRHKPPNNYV